MRLSDGIGVGSIGDEHAGTDDIPGGSSRLLEGIEHDLKAPPRLSSRIRIDEVVGPYGCCAGD